MREISGLAGRAKCISHGTIEQEGFTVNKTTDQKGTQYKHLDLTSCTNSDRDTTLLTFQELSDSSRKNKQLTP
jgi:hypothetical protein